MGVVRDVTIEQLTQAVGNIDTSTLAQDSTLRDVVTAISNISGGNDPVTNTTVNTLGKDTTLQSIAAAISALGSTLGSDKANIDGSNIANPSAFRSAINAASITTDYSFDGTPDSNKQIVTNCPLSYYPFCVINPTRAGWLYGFVYNVNLSTQYWCVQILSTSTPSGKYKGDIVAIKR